MLKISSSQLLKLKHCSKNTFLHIFVLFLSVSKTSSLVLFLRMLVKILSHWCKVIFHLKGFVFQLYSSIFLSIFIVHFLQTFCEYSNNCHLHLLTLTNTCSICLIKWLQEANPISQVQHQHQPVEHPQRSAVSASSCCPMQVNPRLQYHATFCKNKGV